ncbi:hypothetical protein [Salidesulfovibrio onnuriiensis]|uniref:hypothetical protein n=1 Tax=Salidesulfovibrio onnuriiensis TaxID=2583823 RepID=UPI0011CB1825|nr:hypothetical protein [Salidesulfovibrio onnuriiensis]
MSIATPALTNFTSGELSPRLEGRTDLAKYFNGCRTLVNFHVHPHGGATRRSGFRFVAEALGREKPVLLIPFEFNPEQTYILELGEDASGRGCMRVFTDHGLVLDSQGQVYVKDMPYRAEEFSRLRYVQSNDVLILVHAKHPPRRLTRTGHDKWKLEEVFFLGKPEAWKEDNYPSCCCFFEERLVLAATPDKPGTIWFSRTGDMNDFRLKTCEVPQEKWRDLLIKGSKRGRANDTFVVLMGGLFDKSAGIRGLNAKGEDCYYRYKGNRVFAPDTKDQTVTFVHNPSSDSHIESIWDASGVLRDGFWDCLKAGDRVEAPAGDKPLDDDAIEVTLAGREGNNIEFLVPKARLWVGTTGGEWTVGGARLGATTPDNIKANHEGSCGSSGARPETVGFSTLFIQRSGTKIRCMSYRYDSDAYSSSDLTLLSEHITGPGVSQLAYVQEPDSTVYGIRKDGTLVALTYEQDEEVMAWTRLETLGRVESIASIHDDSTRRDELWAVVRRSVNGSERRYIEYLEGGFDGPVEEAFFVDSGLSYRGEPIESLSGLQHLAGEMVSVLADGAVQPDRKVAADGSIELDRPARVVHAGLPYRSMLQPMRLDAGSERGTAQTKRKRIIRVSARFHKTLGGRIGPSEERLEPVYFRSASAPMGSPPGLWSGDKGIRFPKGWDRDGVLTIVQDQPLPMTVLMIVPEVVINE